MNKSSFFKTKWFQGQRKPYRWSTIVTKPCVRCGEPANASWEICADGNIRRPLCKNCDIELNAKVLEWLGHPKASELMRKYKPETPPTNVQAIGVGTMSQPGTQEIPASTTTLGWAQSVHA